MKYLKSFNESKFILSCSNPECDNTSINDDDVKCSVCGEDVIKKEVNGDDKESLIDSINYLSRKINSLMTGDPSGYDKGELTNYYELYVNLKRRLRDIERRGIYRDPYDYRSRSYYDDGDW